MHRRMRAVKRAHSRSRRRMRAVKRAHRRRTKKSATSCGAALGFSVSMKPELFAFGDGAGGAIVDASEAFDACASVDDGDAIFVDFDGLGGATRFARTTTNTRFSIYNRNCHFSSPKTATNQRLCAAPRRTPLCSIFRRKQKAKTATIGTWNLAFGIWHLAFGTRHIWRRGVRWWARR